MLGGIQKTGTFHSPACIRIYVRYLYPMNVNSCEIDEDIFGALPDGRNVTCFTLSNGHMRVSIINLGAAIVSLHTPDRNGELGDIVLGFDQVDEYGDNPFYLGAVVGRYAGRIKNAQFALNGEVHKLDANDGPHSLHGGHHGFHNQFWSKINAISNEECAELTLRLVSPAGDAGFPGELTVTVSYRLTADKKLSVIYGATTDATTPINLTQHSYFNLEGHKAGSIAGHTLHLAADQYLPTSPDHIPTGEFKSVLNSRFDFTKPQRMETDPGYDQTYVLNHNSEFPSWAGQLCAPSCGRTLDIWTDQPGIHVYTGNFLDDIAGKDGAIYNQHAGLCLETQHFPDSPNQPQFPSTILRPGERFSSTSIYEFGCVP